MSDMNNKQLAKELHDAAIDYEGTRIQGLLCRAGDAMLSVHGGHPSGFDSWQDLRGYLLRYNLIGDGDGDCGLVEEAYNHWDDRICERAATCDRLNSDGEPCRHATPHAWESGCEIGCLAKMPFGAVCVPNRKG